MIAIHSSEVVKRADTTTFLPTFYHVGRQTGNCLRGPTSHYNTIGLVFAIILKGEHSKSHDELHLEFELNTMILTDIAIEDLS